MTTARPLTLLVVDDEPQLCDILGFDLTEAGYAVHQATSGTAALGLLEREEIDIVLSDIRMPGMSGVQLLDLVKARSGPGPVVLFLSGYSDITVDEVMDRGAEGILAKPVDLNLLLATLRHVLQPIPARWAMTVATAPTAQLTLSCDNLADAAARHLVTMGRGGLFIGASMLDGKAFSVGQQLGFSIGFRTGPCPRLNGSGVVRWLRPPNPELLASGLGLEFLYLEAGSLRDYHAFIQTAPLRAFIPRQ